MKRRFLAVFFALDTSKSCLQYYYNNTCVANFYAFKMYTHTHMVCINNIHYIQMRTVYNDEIIHQNRMKIYIKDINETINTLDKYTLYNIS